MKRRSSFPGRKESSPLYVCRAVESDRGVPLLLVDRFAFTKRLSPRAILERKPGKDSKRGTIFSQGC